MSANRLITVRSTSHGVKSVESWKFDSWNLTDSQALHTVLTIRDPGDKFQVSFSNPRNGFAPGVVRLAE